MTPEKILSHPPRVLDTSQREFYFENGFVAVERLIDDEWLERLRRLAAEFVDRSRAEAQSGNTFDLAPGHRAASAPAQVSRRPARDVLGVRDRRDRRRRGRCRRT